DKDVSFYFVYKDQHLAGYMKLNVLDAQQEDLGEDALEIERLYLLPGFQGRGIGTHLLYEAEAIAREKDKSKLRLGIWENNDQAIHLRSEEHTSELQSRFDLVCRLLLEK